MGYVILTDGYLIGKGIYSKAEVRELENKGFQLVTVNEYVAQKQN